MLISTEIDLIELNGQETDKVSKKPRVVITSHAQHESDQKLITITCGDMQLTVRLGDLAGVVRTFQASI